MEAAIRDVLYLPKFHYNLLSISKLLQNTNLKFFFLNGHCLLRDCTNGLVLAVGFMAIGLYLITKDSFSSTIKAKFLYPSIAAGVTSSGLPSSHLLWHPRLGHPSPVLFKYLEIPELSSYSLPVVCDVCHFSKQRQDSFPSLQAKAR